MNCPLPRHTPSPTTPHPRPAHGLFIHCLIGCKNTCVCILHFSQNLWGRKGRTDSHMLYWRHTQENFSLPKATSLWVSDPTQTPWPHIWHCFQALLLSKEGVLSVNLRLGTTNLYEVSHRAGGSPSKFQTELGIMQTPICKDPPRLSLSLSGHQAGCQISWSSRSVVSSVGSIGLSFLYWQRFLSCEHTQSWPYAFFPYLGGLEYNFIC